MVTARFWGAVRTLRRWRIAPSEVETVFANDDDGKVYLTTGGGDCAARICQSEIDIKTGKRLTDFKPL